jgi:hypothetical protein
VLPDGRWIILSQTIQRLRFRKSVSSEVMMTPMQFDTVNLELQNLAQTFLPGHRLGIVMSASNYPMFDVNLNNGSAMYTAGDTVSTMIYLWRSYTWPSSLTYKTNKPVNTSVPALSEPAVDVLPYPQPAQERLWLANIDVACDTKSAPIELCSVLGNQLLRFSCDDLSRGIDVSELSTGSYFLRFHGRTVPFTVVH